jgi:hypothetical protein
VDRSMYQCAEMEPLQSSQATQPPRECSITPSRLLGIHPDELHKYWETSAKHLAAPLKYGDDGTTLDEIKQQIVDGRSMLWVYGDQMSIVLSVENNRLYAWLIGGVDLDRWIDELIAGMRRYAKENNMIGLKAVARPGLARKLRRKAWVTTAEIIRMEI